MGEFTSAQFWITTILGVAAPFIVTAVKYIVSLGNTDAIKGRLAFIVTMICSGGIAAGSHYLAKLFTLMPSGYMGEFVQIFALSQIVYQLLKDDINL